ncbi:MAG TPA: SH3 domain-containing protein [Persephonella sp.]|uniref:Bacterial SH3 domain family protein n=1 Tax=Persephonella marina (strain DSM 14350 / EX-H1) TaxID=123214 RepID=C0QTD1_PERMH|nr:MULTISPECIES: SH3 domain-containing protein [Persephonella]ACO03080.1 bacterial SH3 domain family protein [Persephonella marina EX-H1]HCB70435.1 SH3 domain-containing protein [Persephonella sp.]
MIKYLVLSLVIIIMIALDIVLIQEFLYQHKQEEKIPQSANRIDTGPVTTEPQLSAKTEKIKIDSISESEKKEITQTVEEEVSHTADMHITDLSEKKEKPVMEDQTDQISLQDTAKPEESIKPLKAVSTVWLNLRENPRLDSEVLTVINKGDSVLVIDQRFNHWKKVIYIKDDQVYTGWVDDRYLRILEPTQESAVSDSEKPQDQ